jgi:2-dehydro-3-deoxyglucarate aldolase/4-hydroxy-2-oxoheptanedioate aldolase
MKYSDIRSQFRTDSPVGAWVSLPSPGVAEALAGSDVDFVVVDTEHSAATVETVENAVRGIEAAPGSTVPLVRTAWNDDVRIKRLLDTGVAGVVAPQVSSVAEAESFVAATRYPPEGRRGLAASRASAYGRDLDDYYATANDRVVTIAQVESASAVDAAADISAVEGLDSLFVGPADLSASLGVFGEYDHEKFRAAVRTVLDESEVPVGTLAVAPDEIDDWNDLGFDYQVVGADVGFLQQGVDAAVSRYESLE